MDGFSLDYFRKELDNAFLPQREILLFEELESTNTFCRENDLCDGAVVIAEKQSKGRGRMGRSFDSAKGGIYMSIVLKPKLLADELSCITAMSAVALCRAIEKISGLCVQIKWTNDIIANGKKLAGILTETEFAHPGREPEKVIVGIGVNVNRKAESFCKEISSIASSIYEETGKKVSVCSLIVEIIKQMDAMYSSLLCKEKTEFLSYYRRACVTVGKEVKLLWQGREPEKAYAIEIDDSFGLVVELFDGKRKTVKTGEVSVRGLFGYTE